MKIYVPIDDYENDYSCYAIYDSNTIRAYKNQPQLGDNNFTDYFINSHYISKNGVQHIESIQELPLCENLDNITNNYWYRLDLSHIIVIVMFFLIFIFLTYKVFSRLFGRWLKL